MTLDGDMPTVLFSVEIIARELDSKLVTASALAARGCRSIIGHKEAITAIGQASERIVWQGKGLFSDRSTHHLADDLIGKHSITMFHQDEGAMHPVNSWTENVLQKHYVDQIRKRSISRVCMWGARQKEVYVAHAPEVDGIVTVTGSPRFDLCLPKYAWMTAERCEELRRRHAPYILVCSRFTAIAHAEGIVDPFRRKLNPKIWPESFDMRKVTDLWFDKWRRDVQDFADFLVLAKEIAVNFPNYTIIMRPHPSESLAFYKQALSSFENVVVTREGGVLPWIRSAELVVHSNCTTGIEAVLAGRPVVNLLPESAGRTETDVEVAREAGVTATSVPAALEKARELLSGKPASYAWSAHARSMLNNIEAEAMPVMADETLRILEDGKVTSSKVSMPPAMFHIRNVARRVIRGRNAYVASKRGPIDADYVERVMEGCRQNHGGGGRVRHATRQFVVIEPA